ncbi:MAG: cardiolipin synthase [Bacteroidales bacterium]|nr:cardiolipin synthase [Bacteroidales bacterium]
MWAYCLFWAAVAVYMVLIISTVTVVLLENRQPAKTIAWTVVLIMLPILGLIIFYFFGQNIRKERHINRRQYNQLTRRIQSGVRHLPEKFTPPYYAPLIHFFEHTNKNILTVARRIDGYRTGADWLIGLLREIYAAKETIHIETYIIEDDAVGRLVRDALIDKARAGVMVRLIYDDVGCWDVKNRFFRPMQDNGVDVRAFLPVRFPSLTHKVNYRNHRKICIIDNRVGFIGGMNLAMRYVSRRMRPWRDMHLRIEGGAVADMQRIFLSDWYFVCGAKEEVPNMHHQQDAAEKTEVTFSDCLLQIVPANPVSHYPEIMYGLTWIIQHARRYIYIETPYFMPTEPVLQALQTAAMSGVDVRLMVPDRPDGFWLRWVNDSYFTSVLQAGIRVYTYQAGFLHSKCAVADDDWCTVGSSNMDFRSFENNFEANAFIYGESVAVVLRDQFLLDLQQCEEVKLNVWKRRSYRRRLLESYTRILAPLL